MLGLSTPKNVTLEIFPDDDDELRHRFYIRLPFVMHVPLWTMPDLRAGGHVGGVPFHFIYSFTVLLSDLIVPYTIPKVGFFTTSTVSVPVRFF